jgi:hypothetical protein
MVNQKYFSSFVMHTLEVAFVPLHGISMQNCTLTSPSFIRGRIILNKGKAIPATGPGGP